jgi:flavin reductase (DIM6/NTAB) family NADH-FMN oxidoreductase RutF
MPTDSQALRAAMRQWATGVTIVTSAHNGLLAGLTVSSFTSVSLAPPTVLVCLNKESFGHKIVREAGVYAISMLAGPQVDLSNRFAGVDPAITDRFAGVAYHTAETGSPLLEGALAWFDCKVVSMHETGTHTIFIAEVVYAHSAEINSEGLPEPLVYHNRAYKRLVTLA